MESVYVFQGAVFIFGVDELPVNPALTLDTTADGIKLTMTGVPEDATGDLLFGYCHDGADYSEELHLVKQADDCWTAEVDLPQPGDYQFEVYYRGSKIYENFMLTGQLYFPGKRPVVTLTARPASLTGGGTVTLEAAVRNPLSIPTGITVSGSGAGGEEILVQPVENNTWTATLPNKTETYRFHAVYKGKAAEDGKEETYISEACEVKVTASSGGSGGSVGSGGGSPAVTTTTQNDGSTTTATPAAITQDGTATSEVSAGMGRSIVSQAVENGSERVVIEPEITGSVDRTEVTIPSSTVAEIGRKTDADLTISTPVAVVTIPNAVLGGLAEAGGSVRVTAERMGDTVELSVTAGGKSVESVPMMLTVPVPNATPGAVAVLVHENGARELFRGTGELRFSPNLPMSRGMLATALHNLESNPPQALPGPFADVDNGKWYAKGVAWAAANGVVTGYGNGKFGPDDNIKREQLAVMLWRYAGCPAAGTTELRFNDASQVSGYARTALCWATEKGVINCKGGGVLDPAGQATRAETAQILKNFMENQVTE